MPGVHETVYPRFKSSISEKELNDIYTPTQEELKFSKKVARGENAKLCFLIMLKSFQRLENNHSYYTNHDVIAIGIVKILWNKDFY